MRHQPLLFLLLSAHLSLLASPSLCHAVVYDCSSGGGASPTTVSINLNGSSSNRSEFTVSLAPPANSTHCHAEFSGPSGAYFYVRLASLMSSSASVLMIGPRMGSMPTAWITRSNQTSYRAIATASNRLYVRYDYSMMPGATDLPIPIALEVELIASGACPIGWSLSNGLCYGAAHPDNSPADFTNATKGCRQVRANLAMRFQLGSRALRLASLAAGWSASDYDYWVGVADTPDDGVYFLDGTKFFYGFSSSIRFSGSKSSTCPYMSSCRCVFTTRSADTFYRDYCSQPMRYMCSRLPGGDQTFHTPSTLDDRLGVTFNTVFQYYWAVGLVLGAVGVGIGICVRYIWYRRAAGNSRAPAAPANYAMTVHAGQSVPANSHCAAPPGSYPTQPPVAPAAAVTAAYYRPGADADEGANASLKPPAYSEAVPGAPPPPYEG